MKHTYAPYLWTAYGLFPIAEHRFHPTRKWRFDYAWPAFRVACEIEGGFFVGGRHGRGVGAERDMEKYNEAVLLGWRVFRFTPRQFKKGVAQAFMRRVL